MKNIEEIMDFIDCTGKQRRFKFETLESGPLMRLEAREIRNDKQPDYCFREIGMVDHYALLRGSLNLKIKEGLSKRYIVPRNWQAIWILMKRARKYALLWIAIR